MVARGSPHTVSDSSFKRVECLSVLGHTVASDGSSRPDGARARAAMWRSFYRCCASKAARSLPWSKKRSLLRSAVRPVLDFYSIRWALTTRLLGGVDRAQRRMVAIVLGARKEPGEIPEGFVRRRARHAGDTAARDGLRSERRAQRVLAWQDGNATEMPGQPYFCNGMERSVCKSAVYSKTQPPHTWGEQQPESALARYSVDCTTVSRQPRRNTKSADLCPPQQRRLKQREGDRARAKMARSSWPVFSSAVTRLASPIAKLEKHLLEIAAFLAKVHPASTLAGKPIMMCLPILAKSGPSRLKIGKPGTTCAKSSMW